MFNLGKKKNPFVISKKKNVRNVIDNSKVKGFVMYGVNRFVADPNGPHIGKASGRRGYYTGMQPHGTPSPIHPVGPYAHDNLLTQDGRDVIHNNTYISTSISGSGFNKIALSSSTHTPLATDTVLDAEIVAGGLERVTASTRTHTDNTNESTLQNTFVATSAHTDVQLSGLFNAASGVTLGHENTFTPVTLQIDDELEVTWVIAAG